MTAITDDNEEGTSSKLKAFLAKAADELRKARLPDAFPSELERLAGQVDQPCVVAVVGRVKAGKSSFLNALLGDDLAKVGETETTATINWFRYGKTNPAKPVRCYWQNGSVTEEDRAFLDNLQGNDLATLERARGIKYLEYHLLIPYLQQVTLVDTPGLSAVVEEHVERTAEFLALQTELRARHHADTQRLGNEADAVIYLTSQVARVTDQAFLEEFHRVTGGKSTALNAVGVMAKVDLHEGILERRHELAEKITGQLRDKLNTVVPVSSGIQRAVDRLTSLGEIPTFLTTLQRIPPARLGKLLDNIEFFRKPEIEDCPVTLEERERLLRDIPWAVFTAMARAAATRDFKLTETESEWRNLAGFDRLRNVLDRHLIQRGQFLRWYRIVNDAAKVLEDLRYKHLPQHRKLVCESKDRFDRFLQFVRKANGDPVIAKELEEFLGLQQSQLLNDDRLDPNLKGLERSLAEFRHYLEEINEGFEALKLLEANVGAFSIEEVEELRQLFGLYGDAGKCGSQLEHIGGRQQYWVQVSNSDLLEGRRLVAEKAVIFLGIRIHLSVTDKASLTIKV